MAIEPLKVETPTFWPNACICGTQTGPMVDTGIEKYGERIYLCKLCSKLVAGTMGYGKGEEMDRLENASKELHEKEQEVETLRERVLMIDAARVEANGRNERLTGELSKAEGRIAQLEQTLRDVREATVASAGAIVPEDEASARTA